jgi:hypothetical protein
MSADAACELPKRNASSADIDALLGRTRTIAVVGLSPKPDRPSYGVAQYLKAAGYRIIPVNPNATEVFGEKAYATLQDVPGDVDVVDIFRKPEDVPPVVDAAIAKGAKAVWMQTGIVNNAAAEAARAAGLSVVMDRCMMVEHRRWKGQKG